MKKRTLAVLSCGAVLGLGVAACGGDDEQDATAAGAGSTTTEQQETQAQPAGKDIVTLAQETPELSTLVEAVTAADLVETLQGEGPYTVFAPTNDAFDAVGEDALADLLEPANKDQLADLLTYHVVEGELKAADLTDGQTLTTVQGGELTVSVEGDTVKVGDATVAQPDVDASNGVVHVIDSVLMP